MKHSAPSSKRKPSPRLNKKKLNGVMRMRDVLLGLLAAAFLGLTTGCTVASPNAGHEVVWMKKPILFGHGGVNPTPVMAEREYGAMTSDAIDVDMLPQRVDMEFDDMM